MRLGPRSIIRLCSGAIVPVAILCAVLVFQSGCKKSAASTTTIEVKNFSPKEIVIVQITKFKGGFGEIRLKPNVISTTQTTSQTTPEDFAIHWRFAGSSRSTTAIQKSKISLAKIHPSQRTSKIVLEFTSNEKWLVRFE